MSTLDVKNCQLKNNTKVEHKLIASSFMYVCLLMYVCMRSCVCCI